MDLPKGLFALSFEKIPCNEPIKPCQFRTGRRYIQPDNFPDDDGLDHYLGYMAKLSSKVSPNFVFYPIIKTENMLESKADP